MFGLKCFFFFVAEVLFFSSCLSPVRRLRGQSNFTKMAASLPHMDVSTVFARLRQRSSVHPHLTHATLGPVESIHQTASRSVQTFCTAHGRRSLYFAMGRPFSPQNCPCEWWIWSPVSRTLPWAHPTQNPKRHLDQFSRFAVLTIVTDRPTDRPRYSVCINRPHLRTYYDDAA